MFDGGHQDEHRLRRRGQNQGRFGVRSPGHLHFGLVGLGGQINKSALVFLTLEAGVLVELPEEGTRIQAHALAQFSCGESTGRLED